MAWLFITLLLTATFYNLSEGFYAHSKLPSAVVVGTVYCDSCFQQDTFKNSHFIAGATVAVECSSDDISRPSFRGEAKTDEHGEFKVPLPFYVSKHVRMIKKCSVTLITSSEPFCAVSSRAVSSSLHLKSMKEGEHIFSAGFFSFKPENEPEICSQKPRTKKDGNQFRSEKSLEPSVPPFGDPSFPPPLGDPPVSGNQFHLPPLPVLPRLPPLPQLPPLPPLPGLPFLPPLPETSQKRKDSYSSTSSQFSDNKDLNIPDMFLPITPPLFPPVLPQQPPSTLIPTLPPFPGLTPLASSSSTFSKKPSP